MQTPDKYWEGIYWEGVTPESLHAVPLLGAESPDTSTRILIEQCTQRLKHERIRDPELNTSSAPLVEPDPEDYFITIQDAPLTSEDRRTVASWLESPHQRNLSWTTQAQSKVCCYLWHYRAFLGARDGDSTDPGRLCFLMEYLANPNAAEQIEFLRCTNLATPSSERYDAPRVLSAREEQELDEELFAGLDQDSNGAPNEPAAVAAAEDRGAEHSGDQTKPKAKVWPCSIA